jgi:tripartite-type tricarboxylate transporter receptor subunit TctC
MTLALAAPEPRAAPSRRLVAFALGFLLCCCASAAAQDYPSRVITIVVPFPAGGVTDMLARLLADHMGHTLGQSVIVENAGGASGSIGVGRVARAAPDGYTIALGNVETNVFNGAEMPLPYDVVNDFAPVALLPSYPFILVTKNAVPAKDLKELIGWLKANAGTATQGTVNVGTMQQLCGLAIQQRLGVRWQFVPYRGGAPAMQDILAGQIDFMCTATGSFLPLVRSGQVRAYAVTAKSRVAAALDIPTVDEAGLPGLYASVWNAFWAPKGTPQAAIAKLSQAAAAALGDPAVQQRVTEMGLDMPPPGEATPEALGTYQKSEIAKWWPIIKAEGIKVE